MDWERARAILLVAFALVNAILAYSIWGPSEAFPGVSEAPHQKQIEQVRGTLLQRGLVLPDTVAVPRTPAPMQFLHVEYRPTPEFQPGSAELSGRANGPAESPEGAGPYSFLAPTIEKETEALVLSPLATGNAARDVKLENRLHVQQVVEEYLRRESLMPQRASFTGIFPQPETGHLIVEYVPVFQEYPVFSGYVRVEVSSQGIERLKLYWVQPGGYTDAPPKAVRPAVEALLRLAGRLGGSGVKPRVVTDIQLGYYAGRSLTDEDGTTIHGWDTVPVWRISLDTGEVYYINAFNGEWES